MKANLPKIENAVIPYISGITAFHSDGFQKSQTGSLISRDIL